MDKEEKKLGNLDEVFSHVTKSLATSLDSVQTFFKEATDMTCKYQDLLSCITEELSKSIQYSVSEADTCIEAAAQAADEIAKLDKMTEQTRSIKQLVAQLEIDVQRIIFSHPKSKLRDATRTISFPKSNNYSGDFSIAQAVTKDEDI